MTNVTEMPTPNPEPQGTAEERKTAAMSHWKCIVLEAALQSSSSLSIGYHARVLKEGNLWGILGLKDEEEAREKAGVSKATWFNTIRLAEAFKGLPVDLFTSMKLLNAEQLADLPESKKLDRKWVDDASELSTKEFKKLVDEAMNGKARASDSKERTVKMSIDLPASQKTVIESKAREYAESHGIESTNLGQVMESVLVEATEGNTLTGAILHVVERAKKIKDLCESGLSADEVLAQVIVLNEENILECAAVLEVKAEGEEAA